MIKQEVRNWNFRQFFNFNILLNSQSSYQVSFFIFRGIRYELEALRDFILLQKLVTSRMSDNILRSYSLLDLKLATFDKIFSFIHTRHENLFQKEKFH